MTPTTTPPFGPDFVKDLIPWFFQMIEDSTKKAYRMMWDFFITFLLDHWGWVIIFLIGVLILALIEYAITARWAFLGRVLYSYCYFGVLFIIGLIFGPELFANDYFQIFLVILYVVCFLFVGKVLRKLGIKKY